MERKNKYENLEEKQRRRALERHLEELLFNLTLDDIDWKEVQKLQNQMKDM